VTAQTPIIDARDVAEHIIGFKQKLGQCVKFDVFMASEIIYMGLEKMMAELLCRPSLNIHMAGVQKIVTDKRGNGGAMMKAIIAAAGDLNELTASAALPTRQSSEHRTNHNHRKGKGGGNGGNNGSYGVERKKKICILYREYGECKDGEHCNMKHIKPEKQCENAEFKKSGFCDDYWDCLCQHTWDEEKRGDKRNAETTGRMRNRRKERHSERKRLQNTKEEYTWSNLVDVQLSVNVTCNVMKAQMIRHQMQRSWAEVAERAKKSSIFLKDRMLRTLLQQPNEMKTWTQMKVSVNSAKMPV
jgi:hypothetical protein